MDTEAAFEYARIAFELKQIGRAVGQNDIGIAAIALSMGNTSIVTMDGDFKAISGLAVENWANTI